eukprot:g82102.t1
MLLSKQSLAELYTPEDLESDEYAFPKANQLQAEEGQSPWKWLEFHRLGTRGQKSLQRHVERALRMRAHSEDEYRASVKRLGLMFNLDPVALKDLLQRFGSKAERLKLWKLNLKQRLDEVDSHPYYHEKAFSGAGYAVWVRQTATFLHQALMAVSAQLLLQEYGGSDVSDTGCCQLVCKRKSSPLDAGSPMSPLPQVDAGSSPVVESSDNAQPPSAEGEELQFRTPPSSLRFPRPGRPEVTEDDSEELDDIEDEGFQTETKEKKYGTISEQKEAVSATPSRGHSMAGVTEVAIVIRKLTRQRSMNAPAYARNLVVLYRHLLLKCLQTFLLRVDPEHPELRRMQVEQEGKEESPAQVATFAPLDRVSWRLLHQFGEVYGVGGIAQGLVYLDILSRNLNKTSQYFVGVQKTVLFLQKAFAQTSGTRTETGVFRELVQRAFKWSARCLTEYHEVFWQEIAALRVWQLRRGDSFAKLSLAGQPPNHQGELKQAVSQSLLEEIKEDGKPDTQVAIAAEDMGLGEELLFSATDLRLCKVTPALLQCWRTLFTCWQCLSAFEAFSQQKSGPTEETSTEAPASPTSPLKRAPSLSFPAVPNMSPSRHSLLHHAPFSDLSPPALLCEFLAPRLTSYLDQRYQRLRAEVLGSADLSLGLGSHDHLTALLALLQAEIQEERDLAETFLERTYVGQLLLRLVPKLYTEHLWKDAQIYIIDTFTRTDSLNDRQKALTDRDLLAVYGDMVAFYQQVHPPPDTNASLEELRQWFYAPVQRWLEGMKLQSEIWFSDLGQLRSFVRIQALKVSEMPLGEMAQEELAATLVKMVCSFLKQRLSKDEKTSPVWSEFRKRAVAHRKRSSNAGLPDAPRDLSAELLAGLVELFDCHLLAQAILDDILVFERGAMQTSQPFSPALGQQINYVRGEVFSAVRQLAADLSWQLDETLLRLLFATPTLRLQWADMAPDLQPILDRFDAQLVALRQAGAHAALCSDLAKLLALQTQCVLELVLRNQCEGRVGVKYFLNARQRERCSELLNHFLPKLLALGGDPPAPNGSGAPRPLAGPVGWADGASLMAHFALPRPMLRELLLYYEKDTQDVVTQYETHPDLLTSLGKEHKADDPFPGDRKTHTAATLDLSPSFLYDLMANRASAENDGRAAHFLRSRVRPHPAGRRADLATSLGSVL